MLPAQDAADVGAGAVTLGALYTMTDQLAARAISRKLPIVAVVLKQVDHLQRLTSTLQDVVYPQVRAAGRPFHLLVVDDEADDSSIDENDLSDPATLQERQVPRRIVDLWELRQRHGVTAIPELFATYLAYTATPQANFLQDESNPLAPSDFVVSLRTPGAEGDPERRQASYRVPEGLPGWYTGGDVFYRTLATVPLCVTVDDLAEDERLLHGLRAYLVACAIRLSRAAGAVGPCSAANQVFGSPADARAVGGPVMSMLVHPSAAKNTHFETAGRLLAWSADLPPTEGGRLLASDNRLLQTAGVVADMAAAPERWLSWLENYKAAVSVVSRLPGNTPADVELDWSEVRRIILDEIVPATAVAVINSDERADDRPVFKPVPDGDGWRVAPNLSSIFVSGNVMSRGLTLEGLSTTVFTRTSENPAADTQMQMQRWFGYRGKYIDVCRVLMSSTQSTLFRQYDETDLALRNQILAAMSSTSPASPAVLQGRDYKATSKIRNVRGSDLWPGPDPFMTYLNSPERDERNQEVVAELLGESTVGIPDAKGRQGRLLDRTLSLMETAELLDSLSYPAAEFGSTGPSAATKWAAVEAIAGLTEGDPYFPIFRMPADTDPAAWGSEDPYNVAAYLRFWALCLEDRVPAAYSTDEPPLLWSLVDLDRRIADQPRFRVGIRFGAGPAVADGPLLELPWQIPTMERKVAGSRLEGRWGSHNYRDGVLWGDEYFDRYGTGQLPLLTPNRSRAPGSEGLLLFHVIARGFSASIAPALHIPVGGPDQVQAQARRSGETERHDV
jgi:hypothetical protein